MQDGSTLPNSISLDPTEKAEKVSVFENEWLNTGVFPITVSVTDLTTQVSAGINFTVTIKCTKSLSLVSNPPAPVQYNVGTNSLVILELDLPLYEPNPVQCAKGLIEYELFYLNDQSAAFPDFIS